MRGGGGQMMWNAVWIVNVLADTPPPHGETVVADQRPPVWGSAERLRLTGQTDRCCCCFSLNITSALETGMMDTHMHSPTANHCHPHPPPPEL